jgi:cyclopropane-fatty-acyl-phospholipid synthase
MTTSAARPIVGGPWHDVPPAPAAPIRAVVARRVFTRAIERLPLRVSLPGGRSIGRARDVPTMHLHHPDRFFARIGTTGLIGFGESYMAGEWDCFGPGELAASLTPLAANMSTLVPRSLQRLRSWWQARQPASDDNDIAGARTNISRHYDLSNELFATFLDETMTYSSAVWPTADPSASLADAQRAKIDRLLDLARVGVGARVLEIGTGWGELAIRAARRGARVTTITLSREQQSLARRRAATAGVDDAVDVRLCDYREATGEYDAVLSVEMIEAVGEKYWPAYFTAIDRLLARGGVAALQAITIAHDRLLATRDSYTWIHKYVFPGGILPSVRAIEETVGRHTTLRVTACTAFGTHYARTLASWLSNFRANAERVAALGFDDTFRRMWEFYLSYCEAGFAAGYLDVHQIALERP